MHLIVRSLGLTEYVAVWKAMRSFTDSRDEQTLDLSLIHI